MATEHVERRLAAVLAADVAGYSRLMGANEEGTLARLKAVRKALIEPAIASHRGRIVKTTGDGMLVEFASAVDAVRSAVEVQRSMAEQNAGVPKDQKIEFRIGIHIGDIIFDDNDIFGDGVNIAARLEGIAEPGGVCVSDDAYRQVRGKVEEFADLGDKELKNIARPVRVFAVKSGPGSLSAAPRASAPDKADPPRLSIVVLPFANIGGESEQEYFVDGVTESLTTDLSRISGSFVIARNTAFTYKGKPIDVKQIGRELNVRYVLEGSVQRGGTRMRVNVQLIDAQNAKHLWAERFDKPLADLFDMQDEIVARLAGALNTQLVAVEARRAERTPNPDSMDLYFQSLAFANKGLNPGYLAQARNFFERALVLDPGNIEALVGMAMVDTNVASAFLTDDRAARLAVAEATLSRASLIAPEHALAHMCMGYVQISTNRADQGIAECERALALDRNLAMAHGHVGRAKYFAGRAEETETHVCEALRLSPSDTNAFVWTAFAGIAKLQLGDAEKAVALLRRAIELNGNLPLAHFFLAAALARLGQIEEARAAAQHGLALDSTFTIARFRAGASSDHPTFLAQRERIYDDIRKAGIPEG